MSDEAKARLRRYIIAAAAGLVMGLATYWLRGGLAWCATRADKLKLMSDVFTIPGVMLILFSGLAFVAGEGVFDGISFAAKVLWRSLIPGGNLRDKHERYGDYVMRRRDERKKGGVMYLLITGAAFLAVAVIFMAMYYKSK